MEVTRTRTFNTPNGYETVSITVNDLDLSEAELVPPLFEYRAMLLDLLAEKHIITARYRMGGFSRNEEKNEKRAGAELSKVELLRTSIVGPK